MKERGDLSMIEELVTVSIIRRKILEYLPSFYDISSLAKASRYIDYLIYNDNITRDILEYPDKQNIVITNKDGVFENKSRQKLRNITFVEDDKFYGRIDSARHFYGETFIKKNLITINIQNEIQKCRRKDRILFIKKLVEEMRLNCHVRKNSSTLNLTGNFFSNGYILFHTLYYMKHGNVTSIQIPIHCFMAKFRKYNGLKSNIFKGFPKLNKLIFYNNSNINDYQDILKNKNIIKGVLRSFSRKKNPTLVIQCKENSCRILDYILTILHFGNKYNIKIKCDGQFLFPLFRRNSNENCSFLRCVHFPMGEITHYFYYELTNATEFFDIMLNLKCYRNLEELELKFMYSNIKESIGQFCESKSFNSPFVHCKNLKKIKFDFSEYHNEDNFDTFSKDLEYLASLMPTTIEKIELTNANNLSTETIQVMDKYMPNIKLLIMNNGSYKDCDCLSGFQNLQAIISNKNHAIILPRSLKLLAIKNDNSQKDLNSTHIHEELVKIFSEIFKKCLHSSKEQFIFFDDIKYWDKYKCVIQRYFY
uniref:F-box domain-containing protein n=1 Tax=Strongyloides papillosus TaxID=174720 RepID=A0A0N5BSZ0_STREA